MVPPYSGGSKLRTFLNHSRQNRCHNDFYCSIHNADILKIYHVYAVTCLSFHFKDTISHWIRSCIYIWGGGEFVKHEFQFRLFGNTSKIYNIWHQSVSLLLINISYFLGSFWNIIGSKDYFSSWGPLIKMKIFFYRNSTACIQLNYLKKKPIKSTIQLTHLPWGLRYI